MPPPAVVYPPVPAPPPSPYPTSAPPGSPYPTSAPPGYSPNPSSAPPGYQPTYQVPPPRVRTGPPLGQLFFSGDWAGAVQVVLAGVGSMLGVALLVQLITTAGTGSSPSGSQIIGDVARVVSASVGGDLRYESSSGLGSSSASTSFRFLGLTILGFALIGGLFVRRFNRGTGVPSPLQIGLQALRVGVVLSGALLVVAILGRMGGNEFSSAPSADIFTTIFFGLITLAVALALAGTLGLPSLFPGRSGHYRALIFGPLRASLILTVIASALTFVILLVVVFSSEYSQFGKTWRIIPTLLLVAPNIAGYALLFGMGVPVRTSSVFSDSSSSTILDLTDNDARYWLWPIVVLGLLLLTGVISARRSPIGPNGRPIGYWLAAVLPVVLLIYGMVVRVGTGFGFLSFSGSVDLFFAILLGAVFGLVAGYLGSMIASPSTAMAVPVAPPLTYGPIPEPPHVPPSTPPAAPTFGPVSEPPQPSSPAPPPPPPAGPAVTGEPPANPPSPQAG